MILLFEIRLAFVYYSMLYIDVEF